MIDKASTRNTNLPPNLNNSQLDLQLLSSFSSSLVISLPFFWTGLASGFGLCLTIAASNEQIAGSLLIILWVSSSSSSAFSSTARVPLYCWKKAGAVECG